MGSAADKVRKLIALANSAEGTPEGDVARKIADKLLAENGWSDSDLLRQDHRLLMADIPERDEWRRSLLILVAEHAEVTVFETPEGSGFHGINVEIAPAILLFETLVRRIRVAAWEFAEETMYLMPDVALLDQWYSGFAYWAVMGLLERLISGKSEAVDDVVDLAESEDDRVTLPDDDEGSDPPEWASLDEAEKSFHQLLDGDQVVLAYCREGYTFGQEVPLTLGIGSEPEYDMPLLLEGKCEVS